MERCCGSAEQGAVEQPMSQQVLPRHLGHQRYELLRLGGHRRLAPEVLADQQDPDLVHVVGRENLQRHRQVGVGDGARARAKQGDRPAFTAVVEPAHATGAELGELLDEKADKDDSEKIRDARVRVAGVAWPDGSTFGARLAASRLPVDAEPAAASGTSSSAGGRWSAWMVRRAAFSPGWNPSSMVIAGNVSTHR